MVGVIKLSNVLRLLYISLLFGLSINQVFLSVVEVIVPDVLVTRSLVEVVWEEL